MSACSERRSTVQFSSSTMLMGLSAGKRTSGARRITWTGNAAPGLSGGCPNLAIAVIIRRQSATTVCKLDAAV